jgi:hypothetical protein
MFTIKNIFLCEEVTQGQFNKLNLIGYSPSDELLISPFPYTLTTNIVVEGKTNEAYNNLQLKVDLKRTNDREYIPQGIIDLGNNSQTFQLAIPLTIVVQTELLLKSPGELLLRVEKNNKLLFERKIYVRNGKAPVLKEAEHIPTSKIFSGNSDEDNIFVANLLGKAHITLDIYDNYLDVPSLTQLLLKVDNNTKIRIITSIQRRIKFRDDKSLLDKFNNLQIKFADVAHDRITILNGTEYFSFGHSLKDVTKGKLSKFTKIISLKDVQEIQSFFENTWTIAETL